MLLWQLSACLDPEPGAVAEPPVSAPVPATVPAAAPATAPGIFHLVGLADDSHLPLPALPGGATLLGPACFDVNLRLSTLDRRHPGNGPPCGVERWASDTAAFEMLWAGGAGLLHVLDGASPTRDRPAPVRWPSMGPVLAECVGPPLSLPPGGDPGAARTTDGSSWLLAFTGQSRCGLSGQLILNMLADRADARGISVDGAPWLDGGAEAAIERLKPAP